MLPPDKTSFGVALSDGEYVGTCEQFPSLSYVAKTPTCALVGIMRLVVDVLEDAFGKERG